MVCQTISACRESRESRCRPWSRFLVFDPQRCALFSIGSSAIHDQVMHHPYAREETEQSAASTRIDEPSHSSKLRHQRASAGFQWEDYSHCMITAAPRHLSTRSSVAWSARSGPRSAFGDSPEAPPSLSQRPRAFARSCRLFWLLFVLGMRLL